MTLTLSLNHCNQVSHANVELSATRIKILQPHRFFCSGDILVTRRWSSCLQGGVNIFDQEYFVDVSRIIACFALWNFRLWLDEGTSLGRDRPCLNKRSCRTACESCGAGDVAHIRFVAPALAVFKPASNKSTGNVVPMFCRSRRFTFRIGVRFELAGAGFYRWTGSVILSTISSINCL